MAETSRLNLDLVREKIAEVRAGHSRDLVFLALGSVSHGHWRPDLKILEASDGRVKVHNSCWIPLGHIRFQNVEPGAVPRVPFLLVDCRLQALEAS